MKRAPTSTEPAQGTQTAQRRVRDTLKGPVGADRCRYRRLWVLRLAFGMLVGIVAFQLLPVADTRVAVLKDAGASPSAAQIIVLALFAAGGAEGTLILSSIVSRRPNRRESM